MPLSVSLASELSSLFIVALEIEHVVVAESPVKLRLWADQVAADTVRPTQSTSAENLRSAVRQMLRHGKFKASGRSKPAQEYLQRCALEDGSLPRINGPVDVLNACSLAGGLPISLLSLRKCSRNLEIRRGQTDEAYIFNASGQVLDVEDLIVTCDCSSEPSRPVGSPIKDSMAGKIEADDTELVAVVYAPRDQIGVQAALATADMLESKMIEFCQATIGCRYELPQTA